MKLCARLCYHTCVSFCSQGGVYLSACSGTIPQSRHMPRNRHIPPRAETPREQTQNQRRPPGSRHPPGEDLPPRADTPHSRYPPGGDNPRTDIPHPPPLPQSILGYTVNARAVCILLECNLVCVYDLTGLLALLNCVQIHVHLYWLYHRITMEAIKPARYKTAKIHQLQHTPVHS